MIRSVHIIRRSSLSCGSDPRLFAHRDRRAARAAHAARVRGDDRRAQRAARRRWTRTPRAESRALVSRFDGVAELRRDRGGSHRPASVDAYLEYRHARGWRSTSRPATANGFGRASRCSVQVVADGTDANSDERGARIRGHARRRATAASWLPPRARRRPSRSSSARGPRVVQPAAREPDLHDSGHPGPAAARRHDQPVVDGDRAREGAGYAGAAERHAASRRWELIVGKLLPYAPHRRDRRAAGRGGRDLLVRGPAARQLACCCLRMMPGLPADHARPRACSSRRSRSTQQQAMMTVVVLLPDSDGVPVGVRVPDREHAGGGPAGRRYLIPLRYFLVILRGIFLERRRPRDVVAAGAGARSGGASASSCSPHFDRASLAWATVAAGRYRYWESGTIQAIRSSPAIEASASVTAVRRAEARVHPSGPLTTSRRRLVRSHRAAVPAS